MPFVIDASMVLSWHFLDERTPAAMAVLDRTVEEAVLVPAHWLAEVANGALAGERRGRATAAQSSSLIERLDTMMLESDALGSEEAFDRILPLARAHRLTVYDAIYLELAERRGLPLATRDADLAAAARSVGVEVIGAQA
jgi:predicted nucleic acid-binding protein